MTKVDVVSPAELGRAEVELWRELQREDPDLANPFLAPEYAIAVGNARPDTRVARLDEGFFAFQADRFGMGRPLGAGLSDQQAVVCRPDGAPGAHELLARCGLDALRFENVPTSRLPRSVGRVIRYPSPVIDLSDGYEAFIAGRRKASRGLVPTVQRKRRKLEREVGPVRFDFESDDRTVLRAVMKWKSEQYAALGVWDRFADPAVVGLLDELHATKAPGCTGTLSVLYAGDQIAAAHFGLRSERVLTSWFPTYNPDLKSYSPGLLLHFLMAEGAAERGACAFDLGRGEHGYKDVLSSYDNTLARGWAFRRTAVGTGLRVATAPDHRLRAFVRRSPHLRSVLEGPRDKLRAVVRRRAIQRRTAAPGEARAPRTG